MANIKSKIGSIEILFICLIIIFFMFIFFSIYLLYSKININIYSVKQDLFNIVQNSILSFDREELSYNNFEVNEEELVQSVNKLISLNYNNVKLSYLYYDEYEKNIYIAVEVDLKLRKFNIKNKVIIKECFKLEMMRFNNELV